MENIWISWNELNILSVKKELIYFGAGHAVKNTLRKSNKKPLCILDNNKSKENTKLFEIEIISPNKVKNIKTDFIILITTPLFESVAAQLKEMGFRGGIDFFCSPALYNQKIADDILNNPQTVLFTNSDMPDPDNESSGGGLYLFNFKTRELKKLYNGKFHEMVTAKQRLYIIDEIDGVKVFNEELELIDSFEILPWSVPHGLAINREKGVLYIANTGIDSITIMDMENGKHLDEIPISQDLKDIQLDRHHINDLCYYEGYLYISMFSFSALWESGCYDGGVAQMDLESRKIINYPLQNMWMPHSIDFINSEIVLAESMTGTVYKTNMKKLFKADGFLRGITYDGKYYYIAQSEHRYFDRLKDFSNNIQLNCGIHVFDEINKASKFYSFNAMKNIHSIMIKDF